MAFDRPRPERPEPTDATPHAPEQAGHVAAFQEAWIQASRNHAPEEAILKQIYDRAKIEGHSVETLSAVHADVNAGRFREALGRL